MVLSIPYAIPPLIDSLLGRDPSLQIALERPVDNMTAHLTTAGFFVFFLGFMALAIHPPQQIPANPINWIVVAFGFQTIISHGVNAGWDFNPRMLLLPTCFGLLYFLLVFSAPSFRRIRGILACLPLVAVPIALYAAAQSQGFEFLPYSRTIPGTTEEIGMKQMVASTFGHPNYLASYLVPLLPFAAYLVLAPGSLIRKGVGAVCLAVLVTGMLAGGTRGAWLGTLIGILPFYFLTTLSPVYRRPLLFLAGLITVLVFLVLIIPNPFLKVQFDVLDRLLASKEIVARFYYWTIAIELFWQSPLWGIGYGNFNVLFWPAVAEFQLKPGSEYYQFALAEMIRGTPPQFVHNDHLQVLAEGGLLGTALWLGLWTLLFSQLLTAAYDFRHHAATLLFIAAFSAATLGIAVDGLTNFPFHIPASGIVFYALLASWVVTRAHLYGSWTLLAEPVAAPKKTDFLVPELPRVRAGNLR